MSDVRYNLKNTRDGLAYVALIFRYDGVTLTYYTGDRVKPSCWNSETGRMKRAATCTGWAEINEGLDKLRDITLQIYRSHRNQSKNLSKADFKKAIDAQWRGIAAEVSKRETFWEFAESFCKKRAESGQFQANTIKALRTTINTLKRFEHETGVKVGFGKFTESFFHAVAVWMNAEQKASYTIYKFFKRLRIVLNAATDAGLNTDLFFRRRLYSSAQDDTTKIYLTESEVARLAALDLRENERLDNVRDAFLIGCYTGLRYSDYDKIKPENLKEYNGTQIISIRTQKTRAQVALPILKETAAILAKHGGRAPRVISNQKMNAYLKELGKMAGITSPVEVVKYRGGRRIESIYPKCELITTHVARRTFATNEYMRAIAAGRSIRPIMSILGHKSERVFYSYIRVGPEEQAAIFAQQRENGG